jgi:hypothetical protein
MVSSDRGVFTFSNLDFDGLLGLEPPDDPIVSLAAVDIG